MEDFINNTISARIKVVWNFSFVSLNRFSGVIRKKMLQIIKQDVESIGRLRP